MQAETDQSALERLRKVRGVTFEWREGEERHQSHPGKNREMGVIAQEVQAVFPDAVAVHEDGHLMVDYPALVAALIESVKELADRVETLESRLGDR